MLLKRTIILAAALMPLCESMAQPAIGEALRTGELQIPRPSKGKVPGAAIPSATKPAQPKSDTPISVAKVSLRGNRSIETEELRPLLTKLEGRTITLGELDAACAEITDIYRRRGYFLARAFLPEQDVTDGNLVIEVSEAWLEFIRIDNSSLVTNGSIRRKLSAIEVGDVIQVDKVDEAVAATILRTRSPRSGCPCGNIPKCDTFAATKSIADPFRHAATHAPHPIQCAASNAFSASSFPIGIAFASGA